MTDDLALALRLADAADEITSAAFTGAAITHDLKDDGSPVSAADVAVERRIRDVLAVERPGDGMLGEEVGASGPTRRRWIVDGIDGTILFVAGLPGWSTQIALEVDGQIVVGVATNGGDGRRWWAERGAGAWYGPAEGRPEQLAVDGVDDLAAARYSLIPPLDSLSEPHRSALEPLTVATYVPPSIHGALMVAHGRIDVCVQPHGGPWDYAALSVIVTEAGGRVTDLERGCDIYRGGPIVYSNGRIHDAVLDSLRGERGAGGTAPLL